MKDQLKNLLVRFYTSDGVRPIHGKNLFKNESEECVQNTGTGGKHNSNGQLSRAKTNI